MQPMLKISFCINSRHVANHPDWFLRCIAEVESHPEAELGPFVMIDEIGPAGGTSSRASKCRPGLWLWIKRRLWSLLFLVERSLACPKAESVRRLLGKFCPAPRLTHEQRRREDLLQEYISAYGTVRLSVVREGIFTRADATEELQRVEADFLFRWLDSGIIRGTLLTSGSKHGVLSFHHGDMNRFRGDTGFWEWFLNERVVTSSLQVLSEELDGGVIVDEKKIPLCGVGWSRAMGDLARITHLGLRDFLNRYTRSNTGIEGCAGLFPARLLYDRGIFRAPTSLSHLALSSAKLLARLAGIQPRGIYATDRGKEWRILIGLRGGTNIASFVRMKNPCGRWLADPFLAHMESEVYVFFEDACERTEIGRISYAKLPTPDQLRPMSRRGEIELETHVLLDSGTHLSYPYTFADGGQCYLIPEDCANRKVALYRIDRDPTGGMLQATFVRDLLLDTDSVDSSIVLHEGTYFLFTSTRREGYADYSSEMSVFFSDDLLTGEFVSHSLNPVITNPLSARSGGRIWREGTRLFRAAQSYIPEGSHHIEIQRIHVSKRRFSYDVVDRILPEWRPRVRKTHTYDRCARFCVVDEFS